MLRVLRLMILSKRMSDLSWVDDLLQRKRKKKKEKKRSLINVSSYQSVLRHLKY